MSGMYVDFVSQAKLRVQNMFVTELTEIVYQLRLEYVQTYSDSVWGGSL